jgi:hypothetical protein
MKKMHPILAYLLPQPRDILFIGVFFSMIFGGPKLFTNDGDLGRHITIGNYILDTGTIPTRDIFSNTLTGQRLVPHEWLADVIFALAHRLMGLSGDVFIAALLGSFTILIIYNELLKRGSFRLVALFVAAWVTVVSSVHWLARPHMFTFFFMALWTYGLERVYKNERIHILLFPALMVIWANMHGAYFAGFVVLAAYLANWLLDFWRRKQTKELGKRLILIAFLSLAITFINPSGWRLWTTSVGYVGNDFMTSHIVDHLSPNFHEKDMWPFLIMIVFALFALGQEYRLNFRESLLLAGWTAMGLHTVRNLPLFAVITAPIYGDLIQPWAEKMLNWLKPVSGPRESEEVLRGYVWIVVPILFFGFVLWRGIPIDQKGTGNIFLPGTMPVQAVDWLQKNPQDGKMFNHFIWGGYILYRMWPHETVFIDGQTDFYGEALMREYFDVINLSADWESILDKYDVSWLIIPRDETLAKYLSSVDDDAWNVIYEDNTAVIFRRDIGNVSP